MLLACAGLWLLFNGLLAFLFSLFHVICEFDRFLHLIEDEPIFFIQDLKHLCKGNLKLQQNINSTVPSFLIPVKLFKTIIISYNY